MKYSMLSSTLPESPGNLENESPAVTMVRRHKNDPHTKPTYISNSFLRVLNVKHHFTRSSADLAIILPRRKGGGA